MKTTHLFIILPLIFQLVFKVDWVFGQDPGVKQVNDHAALLHNEQLASELVAGEGLDHGTPDDNDLGLTTDNTEEEEYEEDEEEDNDDEEDEQLATHYDIDEDNYYGLLRQTNNHEQEQGDDLGEELFVEEDDDDEQEDEETDTTDTLNNNDGLLFEDDEAPLDFKNNEEIDLDQLLFEASQKDHHTKTEWDDHGSMTSGHDDIDRLLAVADDALNVDPLDETTDEDDHPDHATTDSDQPLPLLPPPNLYKPDRDTASVLDTSSTSHYKLPLFGVLVLLILLYKVSHKSQGGPSIKSLIKDEKNGLPLHVKDLNTQDSVIYPSNSPILATSPISTSMQQHMEQQIEPQHLGRRSSSSSMSSGRKSSVSSVATVGVHGGHTRRISLGHPMLTHSIKESKWEEEWADKRKQ